METIKIYKWEDIRNPIRDIMEEWIAKPTHKQYVYKGIPKFPTGDNDKYLYEYITWLNSNISEFDAIIPELCFIVETKQNHRLFFYVNNIVYAENFPETIP